jgi:CubicO group peptidase (beta-lactamase class C family)
LKNKLKYFIFIFIVILSSFVLSTKTKEAEGSLSKNANSYDSLVVVKKSILIDNFSTIETKKVNQKLDSLLKQINKKQDFHGSVLVAKKGKLIYQNQVGIADFSKKKPLTEESVFQLASVSKQFTAAAILMLNERNQLKLTDTVTTYFPTFPYKNITIKQLLNHTSGLPNYFWIAEHEWENKNPPNNSEMMELLETSIAGKFFRPGRNFDYSNTGYFVLASIIEKISGMNYSTFLKNNIFDPLHMNNSFVYRYNYDSIKENQLEGYRLYRGWRHLKINGTVNDAVVGDKNIYSTTQDLLKWTTVLNSEKLISKESLEMMFNKSETKYGKKIPYGFGVRIDSSKSEKVIFHYGKWNGFNTGISNYPNDLVIIILEHTSYGSLGTLNKKIKTIVEGNFDL